MYILTPKAKRRQSSKFTERGRKRRLVGYKGDSGTVYARKEGTRLVTEERNYKILEQGPRYQNIKDTDEKLQFNIIV